MVSHIELSIVKWIVLKFDGEFVYSEKGVGLFIAGEES